MRTPLILAGLGSLLAACPAPYDPPPELIALNVDKGLYDPTAGPLQLTFSEPLVLRTMTLTLRLDRHTIEYDACLKDSAGNLPPDCEEEATAVLGPCTTNGAAASREPNADGSIKFECEGGSISVSTDNQTVTLETRTSLTPFESYTIDIEAGLEDAGGRTRGVPIRSVFQVASPIACAPTDFRSGFFFAIFDIEVPIAAQFHFFFWIQIDAATGQLRAYGADADPNDPMADTKLNRNPAEWFADTRPEGGAVIEANGQIGEADGDKLVVVYPFDLLVAVPPVLAPGAELAARVTTGPVAGTPAPPDDREHIIGRLFGPQVIFGSGDDQSDLGAGNGTVTMFRIEPSEAPAKTELLRPGVTEADIEAPFEACN